MLDFPDFQTLVNKAFIAERELKLGYDDRKRKFEPKKDNREQFVQKPCIWQPGPSEYKPAWNNGHNNKPVSQDKTFDKQLVLEDCRHNNTCFTCGQSGHYSKQCPARNGNHHLTSSHKSTVLDAAPIRTSIAAKSIISPLRKPAKHQMWSLVCFLLTTYLQ